MPRPRFLLRLVLLAAPAMASSAISLDDVMLGEHLPDAVVRSLDGRVDLELHHQPDFKQAYYLPAVTVPKAEEKEGTVAGPTSERSEGVTQLPPRLLLYGPTYAPDGGLRPFTELPVDAAEYLAHAILEAHFDLVVRVDEERLAQWKERGRILFDDLPEEFRLEALTEALADFGSHLLSLANEIERRRLAGDADRLCRALEHRVGLFGQWGAVFAETPFPGSYYQSAPAGTMPEGGHRILSLRTIQPVDKRKFVTEILRARWTGDVDVDHRGRFCSP